jgi:hypothetical protein
MASMNENSIKEFFTDAKKSESEFPTLIALIILNIYISPKHKKE